MIDYQVGSIVAYHLHNLLQLGKITDLADGYVSFVDSCGQQQRFPAQRFCLFSASPYDLIEFSELLRQKIAALEFDQISSAFSTSEALSWDEYVAAQGLTDDPERFAHYFYIRNHPELFIWKKHKFRPRDAREVADFNRELSKAREQDKLLRKAQSWLEEFMEDPRTALPDDLKRVFKHELSEYLLNGIQTDLIRAVAHTQPELELEAKIRSIRLAMGEIAEDTDPILADSGLAVQFDHALAYSLLQTDFPVAEGVEAFSIDDEDSEDYDDALSVCTLGSGYRIGIHISAVAVRIAWGSQLYQEAMRRVSSLYLAPGVTPLLPEELSNHELSLLSGSERACLSLYVETDSEFQIQNSQFRSETVRIKDNFSYRKIDRMLNQAPFDVLRKFSVALASERGNQTQTRIPKEVYYYIKSVSSKVKLCRIDPNSPARVLIEELMVLFNRSFADYAVRHRVPLIFRNINQFSAEGEDNNVSSQAYLSTTAEFHPGIGTSAYVHATSPIRRFTDLVNQYQLLSRITGKELPFTEDEIAALIPGIEERLLRQREIIQKSGRYWLLKLIQQDHLHTPLPAQVIKHVRDGLLIEFTDWHKRIHLQTDSYARLDSEVQIIITQVFPLEGYAVGDIIS